MCLCEECLPLVARQELEELPDRIQQYFRIPVVQIRSRQKVRTDHLQTVAARLVSPQHQGCRLDRLLDDGNLALIDFEVDQLRRLRFLPGQFLLYLSP
jgi:hypothetical protein